MPGAAKREEAVSFPPHIESSHLLSASNILCNNGGLCWRKSVSIGNAAIERSGIRASSLLQQQKKKKRKSSNGNV